MSQIEVVTTNQRRRRYTDQEKIQIVSESLDSSSGGVMRTARKYDVSPSLLFLWRKKFRERIQPSQAQSQLTPAATMVASPFVRVSQAPECSASDGSYFVHINNQLVIEFPASFDLAQLGKVARTLQEATGAWTQ